MSTTVTCEKCHKRREKHWRRPAPRGWLYFESVEMDLDTHEPIQPVEMHTTVIFACSEECAKNIWIKVD